MTLIRILEMADGSYAEKESRRRAPHRNQSSPKVEETPPPPKVEETPPPPPKVEETPPPKVEETPPKA